MNDIISQLIHGKNYQLCLKEKNSRRYHIRLVPDFGGRSLDTDPNFVRYRKFCGIIIDIHTDRNPYKRVPYQYHRQRGSGMDSFYLKKYIWRDIGTAKCMKNVCFCKNFSHGSLNIKKLVFSRTFWNFR